MPLGRTMPSKMACLLTLAAAVATFVGCPPPGSDQTAPDDGLSQRQLDSLRTVNERKCRQHRSFAFNYARSGLQDDAINQFQKALGYCGDDAELERFYANYLDKWDRKDSAFVHYKRAGMLDTSNVNAHFALYGYYHDAGEYRNAIDELMRAARHQEDGEKRIEWLRVAAEMMDSEGMNDEACALYAQLRELLPEDGSLAGKMVACIGGDDPEARLEALRTACAADSLNRTVCMSCAREEADFDNDGAALAIYMRFAEADPTDVVMWESVLSSARRLGEAETSLAALRRLSDLDPDNLNRSAALIGELFGLERMSEGSRVLLPTLRANPDNGPMLYLAGIYYNSLDGDANRVKALEYLDRAVLTDDPTMKSQAIALHDSIEPPLSDEDIDQAKFFGKKVTRLHRCRIPGREKQNQLLGD